MDTDDVIVTLDTFNLENDAYNICDIKLPKNLPESSIVFDKRYDLWNKAKLLVEKYIVVGASYEINISHSTRYKLIEKFIPNISRNSIKQRMPSLTRFSSITSNKSNKSNKSEWTNKELLYTFDRCCYDMVRFLGYSFSRFKTKPQYIRIKTLYID